MVAANGTSLEEAFEIRRRHVETGEAIPFGAGYNAVVGAEPFHLLLGHQAGVVVLVAGDRQPIALDGVGDEAGRPVVGEPVEGIEHGRQIVTGEVGHQPGQRTVVALGKQRLDAGDAGEIVRQPLAPRGAALEDESGVEGIRAGVDPCPQGRAHPVA